MQDRRDSGVSAAVWGGAGSSNTPDPPTDHPYPANGQGSTGATRVCPPLCEEELEVQSYPAPPRGVPIPPTAHAGPEGLRTIRRYVGTSWKCSHTRPPPGASPSTRAAPAGPKGLGCICRSVGRSSKSHRTRHPHGVYLSPEWPSQDRRESGFSAVVRGGAGSSITPDPPTGRPYPQNRPGKTGGTRVYVPLGAEELETQSYTAPPRGVPIPQTAQARPEGLGCIRRGEGRSRKFNHTGPNTNHPYPPNDPSRTGGTGIYPPLCGEELEVQSYTSPRGGVNIPHTAQAGPEGLGCMGRCLGRNWKFNHTRPPPPGASLSPERPMQNRRDSVASPVMWGGAGRSIITRTPPRSVPLPQTAHAGPEGLECICRSVGRSWKSNRTRHPHVA